MSYTITDDGDEINIRAVITQRWELAELVLKLQQRVDGLAKAITTYVEDVNQLAERNEKFGHMLAGTGEGFDNQDLPRKELSNER